MAHKYTNKKRREIAIKVDAMAKAVGGYVRTSLHNVPHIVTPIGRIKASICYFAKKDFWRIFYPYPAWQQTKITCKSSSEVIERILKLRSTLAK